MRTEYYYDSQCGSKIHACKWLPDREPVGIVQIVHGIAEYVLRYDAFANCLTEHGFVVVAEDHMGHGGSITQEVPKGCFKGGWMGAVEDTCQLFRHTVAEYPDVKCRILFGHSMGSFMARTILAKYPDLGLSGAVICGTGWLPDTVLAAGIAMCSLSCKLHGENEPNEKLYNMVFGGYNKKVEHPKTPSDWLSRNEGNVKAYEADPLCGFIPSAGLLRDMMTGIRYNQNGVHLDAMQKELPVLFIAGGDDPVGNYGAGVRNSVKKFKEHGMQNVSMKIYPLGRHEILNEINRDEVFADTVQWMESIL